MDQKQKTLPPPAPDPDKPGHEEPEAGPAVPNGERWVVPSPCSGFGLHLHLSPRLFAAAGSPPRTLTLPPLARPCEAGPTACAAA